MSQPQPCAHVFALSYICERCGQPAERIVDMPEAFGACWSTCDAIDELAGTRYVTWPETKGPLG